MNISFCDDYSNTDIEYLFEQYSNNSLDATTFIARINGLIEFQLSVCEKLNWTDKDKAYSFIENECNLLIAKIEAIIGYDPSDIWHNFSPEKFYFQHKREVCELGLTLGYLCWNEADGYTLSDSSVEFIELITGRNEPRYDFDEKVIFILEEDINDLWEKECLTTFTDIKVIFSTLQKISYRLNLEIKGNRAEMDFLIKVGVLSSNKKRFVMIFEDFLVVEHKARLMDYVRSSIYKNTDAKRIAITLITLHRLNYLNLDKENRTTMYNTMRQVFNIEFKDASVNYHINNENTGNTAGIMEAAIQKEIINIKDFLC